jgi:hypothetical protein
MSNIANMTEKGYAHKFSNFNIDAIFENHNSNRLFVLSTARTFDSRQKRRPGWENGISS